MSAFLQRLAARSLAALPVLEPRRATRFEPAEAPASDESPVLSGPAAARPPVAERPAPPAPAFKPTGDAPEPRANRSQEGFAELRDTPPAAPRLMGVEPPPAVVIHHHEAPLLVAEPLLAHPLEAAADPAPAPMIQPSLPLLESRPPAQLLARLPQTPMAMPPRGSRPAAGPLAAALSTAPQEEVHISIGRIEIKALPAPGQPPRSRAGANGAPSTLDTYLQQRGRRTP